MERRGLDEVDVTHEEKCSFTRSACRWAPWDETTEGATYVPWWCMVHVNGWMCVAQWLLC